MSSFGPEFPQEVCGSWAGVNEDREHGHKATATRVESDESSPKAWEHDKHQQMSFPPSLDRNVKPWVDVGTHERGRGFTPYPE